MGEVIWIQVLPALPGGERRPLVAVLVPELDFRVHAPQRAHGHAMQRLRASPAIRREQVRPSHRRSALLPLRAGEPARPAARSAYAQMRRPADRAARAGTGLCAPGHRVPAMDKRRADGDERDIGRRTSYAAEGSAHGSGYSHAPLHRRQRWTDRPPRRVPGDDVRGRQGTLRRSARDHTPQVPSVSHRSGQLAIVWPDR
jgi:hypothetical protein